MFCFCKSINYKVVNSLDIPDKLVTRDSITQAEFDTMMQTGLAQAAKQYGYGVVA